MLEPLPANAKYVVKIWLHKHDLYRKMLYTHAVITALQDLGMLLHVEMKDLPNVFPAKNLDKMIDKILSRGDTYAEWHKDTNEYIGSVLGKGVGLDFIDKMLSEKESQA
jgi:hypothetical protein